MSALRSLASLACAAALAPTVAVAQPAPAGAPSAAIPGKVILEARLRHEFVDQKGISDTANALTLRTRFGWSSPKTEGFTFLIEGENVTALVEDYNSTTNGRTAFPVVADPEGTELNRLQVAFANETTEAVLGRQRLIFDNGRFIGNGGFRQNEQTFDAALLTLRPRKDTSFTYVYLDQVLKTSGPKHPQGRWQSDSHLLRAETAMPVGKLVGYGYLFDFADAAAQSSATWGVRLTGSREVRPALFLDYTAEYARQDEYGNNPASFDLDYLALSAGLRGSRSAASLNLEQLDGNGARGFGAPLGTLHAFQGWADVFLNTPANGIRDLNIKATHTFSGVPRVGSVRLTGVVHDFEADRGRARYGREYDIQASMPLTRQLSLEATAARFDGETPAFPDRTKVWLSLDLKL